MTDLVEVPWLLISWNENDYLSKFKLLFQNNNIIKLPDSSKEVFVYTNKDNAIFHLWRWGNYAWLEKIDFNFNEPKFFRRAQRILWIKYLLENKDLRKIYKDKKTWNLCFVNFELEFTVVLKEGNKSFILVTCFHTYDIYRYILKSNRFEETEL